MNKFLIILNGNMNDDVRQFFEKRGVEIEFYDELLPDMFIGKTSLSSDKVKNMQYVYDIKEPREGTLLNQ